jgi:hypothetical protein
MTCTASYTTTQADVDAGHVINAATAAGQPLTGPPVTDTSSATVSAVQNPAITIIKTAEPTTYTTAGQVISYTYNVVNIGNVTLHGITVTDNRLGAISCPPDTLAPGALATCTATHTTTPADVGAGVIDNTADVAGLSPTEQRVTASDTVQVHGPQPERAIVVTKTANAASFALAGVPITYFYEVANDGDVPLHGITVTDDKIPAAPTCPDTALAVGQSMTCTATYTVTPADVTAQRITNTGTATGLPPTGPATSGSNTLTIPLALIPAISVTKTAVPASFSAVGQVIRYTYLVVNNGTGTLSQVSISDDKVSNASCTNSAVPQGESKTCTGSYTVTAADLAAGHISNTATVTARHGMTTVHSLQVSLTVPRVPAG